MATQQIFLLGTPGVAPSYWGNTQLNGSAPTAANSAFGWTVAKTAVTTPYWRGRLGATVKASAAAQAASWNAAASGPTPGTGTTATTASDSFAVGQFNGSFAAGNWVVTCAMRANTAGAQGNVRVRAWRSVNANGSGATQLFANTASNSGALSTTVDLTCTVSVALGALSMNSSGEYLFFQIEWQETTAGSSNNSDVVFRVGASTVVTPDYTPGPTTGTLNIAEDPDTLAAIPYGAKWGLIAHTAIQAAGPTNTSGAIDTSGANLIVLGWTMYGGSFTVPLNVTDNKGNQYTAAGTQATNTAEVWTQIYYCLIADTGPGHTFTITNPNGQDSNSTLTVAAFAGLGDFAYDVGSNGPAGTTTASTGSITPSSDDELLVTTVGVGPAGATITTVGGGFTKTDSINFTGGIAEGGGLAYLIQTTVAAANPVWQTPATTRAVAKIAAFRANASVLPARTGTLAITEANDTVAAVGGSGDWFLVASTAHASPSGPTNVTTAINTTGANFIALAFTMYGGAYTAPASITDNKGNTYTAAGAYDMVPSTELLTQIYYCLTPTVGTGHTFTYSQGGTNDTNSVLAVSAFAGPLNCSYSLDQFQNGAAGATSCNPGSITPAIDKELLILAAGSGVAGSSFGTVTAGFLITNSINFTTGSNEGGGMAYLSQGTAAAVNPVWTIPGGTIAVAKIAAFRADTLGPPVGSLVVTEANDTVSAAGNVPVIGTLSRTEADDSLVAAGGPRVDATLAITEANDTLVAAGGPRVGGTLTVAEVNDALSATGNVAALPTVVGTLTLLEANDTLAAAGNVPLVVIAGNLAITEANDTLVAAGGPRVGGTLGITETNDTLVAAGGPRVGGTLVITEVGDTLTAAGTVPLATAGAAQIMMMA